MIRVLVVANEEGEDSDDDLEVAIRASLVNGIVPQTEIVEVDMSEADSGPSHSQTQATRLYGNLENTSLVGRSAAMYQALRASYSK